MDTAEQAVRESYEVYKETQDQITQEIAVQIQTMATAILEHEIPTRVLSAAHVAKFAETVGGSLYFNHLYELTYYNMTHGLQRGEYGEEAIMNQTICEVVTISLSNTHQYGDILQVQGEIVDAFNTGRNNRRNYDRAKGELVEDLEYYKAQGALNTYG